MAVQVQFISLTQEEYDSLETKQNGKLYFTTDTHRIYKGNDSYGIGEQEIDSSLSNFVKLQSDEGQNIESDLNINGFVKVGSLEVGSEAETAYQRLKELLAQRFSELDSTESTINDIVMIMKSL